MNFKMEKNYHSFSETFKKESSHYVSPYERDNRLIVEKQQIKTNDQYRKFLTANSEKMRSYNTKKYENA